PPAIKDSTYKDPPVSTKPHSNPPSNYDTINSRFANKDEWNGPATVGWSYSIDDAKKLVQSNRAAFAIYFCQENAAKTSGEGPAAIETYKKANNGAAPPETVFDLTGVLNEFNTAGISTFVKIPASNENAKLLQTYGVAPNTLVVCTPDGDKLWACSGAECTAGTVTQFLTNDFKGKFAAWKQAAKAR